MNFLCIYANIIHPKSEHLGQLTIQTNARLHFLGFTIILVGLAVGFLIVAIIFRKKKVLKWIFGSLSLITLLVYLMAFCLPHSIDWLVYQKISGKFHNEQTNTWIYLHADGSYSSNAGLFDCTKGGWKFIQTEEFLTIMLESSCEQGTDFFQIPLKDNDKLTFSPQDTRTFTGNELDYIRK
jgi:uncharacterized cupin superfamily protein